MPTQTPKMRMASAKHAANITKRGNVPQSRLVKEDNELPISNTTLAILLFVVVGSAIVGALASISTPTTQ
ncbi:hypothetical protein SARC_07374 [Sphaeroforma arctica JP610]|uniref:Stress-associated endoplasmic reticulum protein n=1 Tax=Sphaeroforma arctica JP610 TaxID=667725 RepID=A0A0L0FUD7_9EUKA|nr:hypothetical protein SARC_07374 [Sphaeroforma arctica JP610]KNC80264.1 hypothetical protein SARC_07374 [Sphaeroforma arctica JP610]|eukprot:XP_014154166.1 hypothetical protein SARC_07374 [Sphaeroforma arctica JP610]